MKYYVRQVRPYVETLLMPGIYGAAAPLEGYDYVPEDMEEQLRNEIVISNPSYRLIFNEKFVEV